LAWKFPHTGIQTQTRTDTHKPGQVWVVSAED